MRSFAIGIVLAAAVLVAGFLVPRFLPSATGPGTLKALEDAELARRQIHVYDASLPLLAVRSDAEQLRAADFDTLVDRSREDFERLGKEFGELVRAAKGRDRQHNLPERDLKPIAISPPGVKAAVAQFETSLRSNRSLLNDAKSNARSASQADRNALGVEQVAGTVKLVEASDSLAEARRLRAQLTGEAARLIAAAARWAGVRAEKDHFAGLDVATIRRDLNKDLEEITSNVSAARSQVDELAATVAERRRKLADLSAQLDQARTERLTMEEMGFTVGDDASFEAHREKYLRIAQRLQELQEQEQLLAFGGIEGGKVADDPLAEGTIEGGETVIGLNELERRLAIASDKLERYTRGSQTLENQMSLVGAAGDQAQTQEELYARRLEELAAEVDRIRTDMTELARQASEKEDAALAATRDAARAFGNAKSAVDRWKSEARALQQTKDPQRANQRLRRIAGDAFAADFASSSVAQAKTLIGRILTERALGLAGYIDALKRTGELMPGATIDVQALEQSLTTSRDEAVSVLGEARDTYERLAQTQTDTTWIHQSSLAAVYHLLWQIDEFNAAQHRGNLIDQLGKAVAQRRESPFLRKQVELYDTVTGGTEPQPPPQQDVDEPDEEQAPDEDQGE